MNDFEKASDYHKEARELASEATGHDPKFTDKEKINLEIYAERQNDAAERERYLELARATSHAQEQEVSSSAWCTSMQIIAARCHFCNLPINMSHTRQT